MFRAMRWAIILASTGFLLAGCQSEQPATGKDLAQLNASCEAYGFKKGTDAYSNCVLQLDQQRIATNRQRRMAIADAFSEAGENMSASAAANRPVNCTSRPGYGGTVQTTCY
jgi:hypothetical protein